jgi:hypothetical protein
LPPLKLWVKSFSWSITKTSGSTIPICLCAHGLQKTSPKARAKTNAPRPATSRTRLGDVLQGGAGHGGAPSGTVVHGRARRSASGHGGWVGPRGALGSRAEWCWVGLVGQRRRFPTKLRCQTRPTQNRSVQLPSAPRGPTQPPCPEALRRARPCPTVHDGARPSPAPPCNTSPNRVRGGAGRPLDSGIHRPGILEAATTLIAGEKYPGSLGTSSGFCSKQSVKAGVWYTAVKCLAGRHHSNFRHVLAWFLGGSIRVLHQAKHKC